MSSQRKDQDDGDDLRARLERLSIQLKSRGAASNSELGRRPAAPGALGSTMSLAFRAGSEFVAAIIVGAGIGWLLDRALGTKPAFIIAFFMIGVAAGVWNVIRVTSAKTGSSRLNSPLSGADPTAKGLQRSGPIGVNNAPEARESPGAASWDDDED